MFWKIISLGLRIFWIFGLIAEFVIALPVFADDQSPLLEDKSRGVAVESLSAEQFQSHFETHAGKAVVIPEIRLKGTLRLAPRWRIFFIHYRGTSASVNGFQASLGDFEGRVAYRLDDPDNPIVTGSATQNVHVWISWDIWSTTNSLNGALFQERDEGAGFGITRKASRTGLSYWYTFGIYPSVRTPIGNQDDSLLYDAGLVYNFDKNIAGIFGYTIRTYRTSRDPNSRAQEQGLLFGLRGNF